MLLPTAVSKDQPVPLTASATVWTSPERSRMFGVRNHKRRCHVIAMTDGYEFECPEDAEIQDVAFKDLSVGTVLHTPTLPLTGVTDKLPFAYKYIGAGGLEVENEGTMTVTPAKAELLGWLTLENHELKASQSRRFSSSSLPKKKRVADLVAESFPELTDNWYEGYMTITGGGRHNNLTALLTACSHDCSTGSFPINLSLLSPQTIHAFLGGYLSRRFWYTFNGHNPECGIDPTHSIIYARLQQHMLRHLGIDSRILRERVKKHDRYRVVFPNRTGYNNVRKLLRSFPEFIEMPEIRSRPARVSKTGLIQDTVCNWSIAEIREIRSVGTKLTYGLLDNELKLQSDGGQQN